jgi:hypothetical protein
MIEQLKKFFVRLVIHLFAISKHSFEIANRWNPQQIAPFIPHQPKRYGVRIPVGQAKKSIFARWVLINCNLSHALSVFGGFCFQMLN